MEVTTVYLLQGFAIYVGQLHDNSLHRHPFVQLILGMGATFELECEGGPWSEPVALINSNQLHRVRTDSGRLVVLLIEPELHQSRALMRRYFSESEIVRPAPALVDPLIDEYQALLDSVVSGAVATRVAATTLDSLAPPDLPAPPMSDKIEQALALLEDPPAERFGARELARRIGLSESRLTHLFREQVGMPVRKYVLWRRLQNAVRSTLAGCSFTESAHAAGFADSAHLSRTFRAMFGQKMLDIFTHYRTELPVRIVTADD